MQSPYIPKMLKKLFNEKIHMHLYLVPYSTVWNVYQQYFKLDKNEKYFHLHNAVPFNEVQKEIAKYDFGAIIRPFEYMKGFSLESLKIGARSYRQYNFFEAGLPLIISNKLEYLTKIVKTHQIGFGINNNEIENLIKIIENYNYNNLVNNVYKFRKNWLIQNHIKRVNDFYENILS
jgi:hypothetical protein